MLKQMNRAFDSIFPYYLSLRAKMRRQFLACLPIILFFFMPACADNVFYVQPEVLSLRSEPSESATVSGRIRINTQVRVVEKRKEWLKVASGGLEGWVPRSLLASKPLTLENAVKKANSSAGAEKIAWLERAVAIGSQKDHLTSLLAAYQEAGLKDKAGHVRDFLDGRSPVYIAACDNGRAFLLGVYTAGSGLKSFVIVSNSYDESENKALADDIEELERLAPELAIAAWYSPGQEMPIAGTPFPNPSLGGTEIAAGGMEHTALVMGACSGNGIIFTTAPVDVDSPHRISDSAVHEKVVSALRDAGAIREFTSLTVDRFSNPPAFYEIMFGWDQESEVDAHWLGRSVLDAKYQHLSSCQEGENVFPLSLNRCKDKEGKQSCSAVIEDFSWIKPRLVPGVRFTIKKWSQSSTMKELNDEMRYLREGIWFVFLNVTGCAQLIEITIRSEGC